MVLHTSRPKLARRTQTGIDCDFSNRRTDAFDASARGEGWNPTLVEYQLSWKNEYVSKGIANRGKDWIVPLRRYTGEWKGFALWARPMTNTWLILPVVICLSQRLSHACLSTCLNTVKPRIAHYNSHRLLEYRYPTWITVAILELIHASKLSP